LWNDEVIWVKLYPTNDKTELLVEFLLPAKIHLSELWQTGIQMCSMFAVSLNVATAGYFWWYLPKFVSTFYEEIVDLETKGKLGVDYKSPVMGSWKRTALKAQQLHVAGMILSYLVTGATKAQSLAYSRYMQGLALLSKNDVFGDFTGQALVHFAHAFRMALAGFGDWDGVPEHFQQAAVAAIDRLWNQPEILAEFNSLMDLADALEGRQPPSRLVTLEEALKLKALCDVYLAVQTRREVQKLVLQHRSSTQSRAHEDAGGPADRAASEGAASAPSV
jgi:hypothetical protein